MDNVKVIAIRAFENIHFSGLLPELQAQRSALAFEFQGFVITPRYDRLRKTPRDQ